MKNILLFILVLVVPVLGFSQKKKQKQANKETEEWRYEIEVVDEGAQGTCLIKVWSYSAKPEIAKNQAKKNAVHGVLFKGVPGTKDNTIPARKPLVKDAKTIEECKDFFTEFFKDGGDYMRYVTLTNDGAVAAGDVMKVGKKEYKVGVIVSVRYDDLKKLLEEKGIRKKLGAGF